MDCWALVRDHLAPEQRATLADVSAADAGRVEAIARAEVDAGRWSAVWPPAPGDVVLMGSAGEAKHAGIVVEGGVKHWTRRHGVVVQPLRALRAYRQLRAYRWAG